MSADGPPVGRFTIIIDALVDGEDVHLNLTSRPMLATHSIAHILESTAREIRAGRLDALEIRPLQDG